MKNRDIFHKDPLSWQLLNEGVSSNNATDPATLRYELQTFVCDGEYRTGLVRILEGYLANFNTPEQKAVWVSGFYGSGKSHLVKAWGACACACLGSFLRHWIFRRNTLTESFF